MGAVILAFQLARRTGLPARLLAAANAMAIEDRIAGAIVVAAVTPRPFGSGRKHGGGWAILGRGQNSMFSVHRPAHWSSSASRIRGVYSR